MGMVFVVAMASPSLDGTVALAVFETPDVSDPDDVAGLDLSIEHVDKGTHLEQKCLNESQVTSTVTRIYFEEGLLGILENAAILGQSEGVAFVDAKKLKDPPGGTPIGWDGSMFEVDRLKKGGVSNGIDNPDEWLLLGFDYAAGKGLSDFLGVITTTGRIAEHVQRVGDDGISVSVATVPLPLAGLMGVFLLGGLAAHRSVRRRTVR